MSAGRHLDFLLQEWPYDPDEAVVRLVKGRDGRDLLQMRVDLGVLQMETSGRPDGARPEGYPTLLDWLSQREVEDPDFEFDDDLCYEIEREFMQFYHRRMAWLRLQRYEQAMRDADHTLALMDLCRDHSPCEEWTMQHEQHRALVLFQRAQAAALHAIEQSLPQVAIREIDDALLRIAENYADMGWESEYESDELVDRLKHLRETIRNDFQIGKTLEDQLAEAVAREQYELAAKLRDEMARRENA
ncbi:MAG: DNA helicase UvrBC [Planctomycetota bacterium]|nr:MAG: DNA helicase UvrBC [Planctomycetota bacterium]